MARATRLAWLGGILGATGLIAACFPAPGSLEDSDGDDNAITAGTDTTGLLKSTLILSTDCMAVKVGPKTLLTAARCVDGKSAYAAGKTITFKTVARNAVATSDTTSSASDSTTGTGTKEVTDGSTTATMTDDGGTAVTDGGTTAVTVKQNTSVTEATIASVTVHDSWTSACAGDKCAFGATTAASVIDLAVIELDSVLVNIPTVPVDQDPVNSGDSVSTVESGCNGVNDSVVAAKSVSSQAVPGTNVKTHGTYKAADDKIVGALDINYSVTRGIGWQDATEGKLCKSDIGGPLFRAESAAVAGITTNFTARTDKPNVPVTIEHVRLDSSKVATWLSAHGAEFAKSCSDTTAGCKKHSYDGGAPDPDAGTKTETGDAGDAGLDSGKKSTTDDTTNGDLPSHATEKNPPEALPDYTPSNNPDTDGGTSGKKKKKAATGGCSSAPGTDAGDAGLLSGLGILIGAVIARRRKTTSKG